MLKKSLTAALLTLTLLASSALALSPNEQAFIDKHLSDILTTTTTRVAAPGFGKVFNAMIFEITFNIVQGDGNTNSEKAIVAKIDDKLVPLSRPGTDADCPTLLKMFNPKFKLATDADAKLLQAALDTLYPILMDDDKKTAAFTHTGNAWSFIRGKFFDKHLGFTFTTDNSGAVTAAKFSLKLP